MSEYKPKWCKNPFKIDDSVPFHHNWSFWGWAIVLPSMIILGLGSGSYQEAGPLCFSWNQSGYDFFLTFYKFPLWFLPSIPLIGLTIARMHGSKQRDVAIKESTRKNDFDMLFKHMEEFNSFLADTKYDVDKLIDPLYSVAIRVRPHHSHSSYHLYFPNNITSPVDMCPPKEGVIKMWETARTLIEDELDGLDLDYCHDANVVKTMLFTLERTLGLRILELSKAPLSTAEGTETEVDHNLTMEHLRGIYILCSKVVDHISNFMGSSERAGGVRTIAIPRAVDVPNLTKFYHAAKTRRMETDF